MLPLLPRLLGTGRGSEQPQGQTALMFVARQFVGGSALAWVEQHGCQAGHLQATLLPLVLHTVRLVVQNAAWCGCDSQRGELLQEMHAAEWLGLLARQLQPCGYTARLAALQLATALLEAQPGGCSATTAGQLLAAAMRHVLMPRELWGTGHWHGKAAVLHALALLRCITHTVPAAEWAEAWAEVGTTFWLSRAAADSSPAVAQRAFDLLAAAAAAPPTHRLLLQAWPECGDVAITAALDASRPAAVRGAALAVLAAALSHGTQPPGTDMAATAAGEAAAPDEAAQGGEAGSPRQALAALRPLPSMAAEQLLQHHDLWAAVQAILQVSRAG